MTNSTPGSGNSPERIPDSPNDSGAEEFNLLIQEVQRREEVSRLESKLLEFTKAAWGIVEKGRAFSVAFHHEIIAEHLEAVLDGRIKNLIVNVPPRHTKSTLASIMFPAWAWIKKPALKWLFVSFKEALALEHSQACRDILGSTWYQSRWPAVKIRSDQDSRQKFVNTETGHRIAASVDSSATGVGGDIICCDDPHALSETFSEAERTAAIRWWNTTMSSRLNDRQTGARIIICQRIHEADLTGTLIKGKQWTHVVLPAEYVPTKTYSSPLGAQWNDPRKAEGDLLWPERFPKSVQEEIKQENGSYAYSSQQQQDPAPGEGGMFSAKYFRYFSRNGDYYALTQTNGTTISYGKGNLVFFQVFDTAVKEQETVKADPDYSVCLTAAITPENDLLVIDLVRERIPVPKLYGWTCQMRQRFPWISWQFMEDKSSGQGLIQEGKSSRFPFLDLKARMRDKGVTDFFTKDKQQRAVPVSILYENGKVYHLAGARWLVDFEHELLTFPVAAHDDQVDALAYAGACHKYGPRYSSTAMQMANQPLGHGLTEDQKRDRGINPADARGYHPDDRDRPGYREPSEYQRGLNLGGNPWRDLYGG